MSPLLVVISTADGTQVSDILDAGADDVLCLHSQPDQTLSRLNALTRRAAANREVSMRFGHVTYAPGGGLPCVEGNPVPLTAKEARIFALLADNPGKIVSKKAVYDTLYAFSDNPPFEKVIDVHIFNIRKKLDAASKGKGRLIETISGLGYTLLAS